MSKNLAVAQHGYGILPCMIILMFCHGSRMVFELLGKGCGESHQNIA